MVGIRTSPRGFRIQHRVRPKDRRGGSRMRMGRLGIAIVAAGGLVWAMWTDPPPRPLYELRPPAAVRTDLGTAHDPKDCGTIVGRVIWDGPAPAVPPLDLPASTLIPSRTRTVPNPN